MNDPSGENSLLSSWSWDLSQIVIRRLPSVSGRLSVDLQAARDSWVSRALLQQYYQIVLSGPFCGIPPAVIKPHDQKLILAYG